MRNLSLATVCEEAACPNIGECWDKKHATFMIMGEVCTRACAFCNVATGKPKELDKMEPLRVGVAVGQMGLVQLYESLLRREGIGVQEFEERLRSEFITGQIQGGLAGSAVKKANIEMIRRLRALLPEQVSINGVGGIFDAADAYEHLEAGACAIQCTTGYLEYGNKVFEPILQGLADMLPDAA